MKRWWIPAALVPVLIILLLGQTAVDPGDFTGQWYSSQEQCIYLFREGLIYCEKYPVPVSSEAAISGAYTFSGNSIYLFASGMEGLGESRELYLVETREGSMLCEHSDGSGQIYFVRDNKRK